MRPDDLSRRRFLEASAVAGAVVVVGVGITAAPALAASTVPLAAHLISRLRQHGADRLFGVPGATCDPLFAAAESASMPIVVTSSDLEAGYAADGFARVRGLSAVAVTYGVGTMGLLSVVGGAFAEKSPIVVINGGPSPEDLRLQRDYGTLFSHSTGRDSSDLTMFREVTAFAERIESAADAPRIIDLALRVALTERRPVYLEVPKHLWTSAVPAPAVGPILVSPAPSGSEGALAKEIGARLSAAKRPALLVGAEVGRHGHVDAVTALVKRWGLPYATTFLGKSVLADSTPGFVGVYTGKRAVPAVRRTIEEADALLAIGCVFGRQYRGLVTERKDALMRIDQQGARIGGEGRRAADLGATLAALQALTMGPLPKGAPPAGLFFDQRRASLATSVAAPTTERGLGFDELLREVSRNLTDEFVTLTDTSLSMAPAADLDIPGTNGFLCNGVWQAIGWSLGAATGVAMASGKRPLVICGDGGLQMTIQGLSTLARHQIRGIVIVLDNGHYGIEQWLLEPAYFTKPTAKVRPYLALQKWDYAAVARGMGITHTATVDTVAAFASALTAAKGADGPSLIAATIRPHDLPAGYSGAA